MRALVIDEAAKDRIAKVVKYAKTYPVTVESLQDRIAGKLPAVGDNPEHVVKLFFGITVVFSWQIQPDKFAYRHISVSVDNPDKMPNPVMFNELLGQFGFEGRLADGLKLLKVWIEVIPGSPVRAINAMEPVRGWDGSETDVPCPTCGYDMIDDDDGQGPFCDDAECVDAGKGGTEDEGG